MCANLLFSFGHQIVAEQAGYRILPQTKVTLTDTIERTYRSYADTSFVTFNTVTATVRGEIIHVLFGASSYSHRDRDFDNIVNGDTSALLTNGGLNRDPACLLICFEGFPQT